MDYSLLCIDVCTTSASVNKLIPYLLLFFALQMPVWIGRLPSLVRLFALQCLCEYDFSLFGIVNCIANASVNRVPYSVLLLAIQKPLWIEIIPYLVLRFALLIPMWIGIILYLLRVLFFALQSQTHMCCKSSRRGNALAHKDKSSSVEQRCGEPPFQHQLLIYQDLVIAKWSKTEKQNTR